MKRALISVSDKTGVVELATTLRSFNYTLYSTGGTYTLLQQHHIPVNSIETLTDFPEILNGRVKTLHPHVHGGILADQHNAAHRESCKQHNIKFLHMVIVNLYPFEQTISKKDCTLDQAIEQIDIGGPTLIRAAAKNYHSVCPVTSPEDYTLVADELARHNGELPVDVKKALAARAFQRIAHYDIAISNYFSNLTNDACDSLPETLTLSLEKISPLRYGENPHQDAALYAPSVQSQTPFTQLQGKDLSYNNLLDTDAAIAIVREYSLPAAVIIKHTNPCGAATGTSIAEAYHLAHEADPVSAFGSIVALNRCVDIDCAHILSQTFIEVIIAPNFDDEALEIFKKKTNLRLIKTSVTPIHTPSFALKAIHDMVLVQTTDTKRVTSDTFNTVTSLHPSKAGLNDCEFGFSLVKHVKSNAIVVVKDGQSIGIGAGQMSRIDAVTIALQKAGEKAQGAILASDAFFPFDDSVKLCAQYGISTIIQPGGSKRDKESIDACNANQLSMVFTGSRHFKH